MSEDEIKAMIWLLEEINNDKIIASYFRQKLNCHNTDIVKLIKKFKDICKTLDNPMYYKGDEVDISITPNVRIMK